ncbi:hypothetical protein XELAEV_18016725mg [Xenopus laevis]|uniref:CCHC-type domain-containing protein n=1 Tax=Xenopus laevis TaxID=8355 RepID=A0A974HRR4_XENLA|nr:hypothetical protein XELAEV_18016725mg [Xenopus laevis]
MNLYQKERNCKEEVGNVARFLYFADPSKASFSFLSDTKITVNYRFLYYLEALIVLKHLQRPGVVVNMSVEEWCRRTPSVTKKFMVIGVKKHKTSTHQVARSSKKKRRRRNAVHLRWVGEGFPPDTRVVMDKVLEMEFTADDLNCLVHNSVFRDYSISFIRPQELEKFWFVFKQMELVGSFKRFEAVAVSMPSVVKINIILENESIPRLDLKVWLNRDLVCCSYPGHPRECWKCGSTRHLSISCDVLKCAMCLDVGHVAKTCPKSIRCNLCRELGHAYGSCPISWHKIDEEFRTQGDDAQVDDDAMSVGVVEETQLSTESGSEGGEEVSELLFVSPVPLLSSLISSLSGKRDRVGVPQRGRGGGRPIPQWNRGPQGPSRTGPKKVTGKSGYVSAAGLQFKERVRRVESSAKIPFGERWVKVGKKGGLDPLKGDEVCRKKEAALSIDTSNRYGPLSWGERVEIEEGGQGEIQEELRRIGAEDVDSCSPVSSESEFEDIDLEVAEGMPSGMSAKRECSEDDRRIKRRAEAAAS